jgi:hypothetical protein
MLSMYPEDRFALRAFKAGAAAYVNKASAADELVEAVRKAAKGGRYISPVVADLRQIRQADRPRAFDQREHGEYASRPHPEKNGDARQCRIDPLRGRARAHGVTHRLSSLPPLDGPAKGTRAHSVVPSPKRDTRVANPATRALANPVIFRAAPRC